MIGQRTPMEIPRTDGVPAQSETLIYLRKEGSLKGGRDCFKILKTVGEGVSCVCYEATLLGEQKTGRLKELYPLSAFSAGSSYTLERTAQNYVAATAGAIADFVQERDEFVEAHHLLRKIMDENKDNADFTSFIPDFTIYYACDEEGKVVEGSTAYVWTAPQNLTVFEEYIDDVHAHPDVYPEHKLFTILKTMITLAECIRIFHENALLHLDIKPGNFGIPQRKDRLLTDSITLFDVNTIYSPSADHFVAYGTEGFCAPELTRGYADNTSDIYSIGCTLFTALMVCDEMETFGYSRRYYTRIPQMLEASKLIAASEANSNVFLKRELCTILKKCLAESPMRRYESCTDLVKDLEKALVYLYPSELSANLPENKQLVILEKELDKKQGAGSFLTIMYHLYKHPLFALAPPDSEEVDVLVVGFGNYGQRFLDSCLQLAQLLGKPLNVRVLSGSPEDGLRDKEIYLAARPALAEFFGIDGAPCEEPYGTITFANRIFSHRDIEGGASLARTVAEEVHAGTYVFVALGDDSLNLRVAEAIATTARNDKGVECSVNFAYGGKHISEELHANPIYTADDVTQEPLFRELERMAFNVHLVWENGLNIDFEKSYQRFKEPYYYNPSFSNVISIKYKLYGLGIDMDDPREAAARYYREMAAWQPEKRNELGALEHRRWVCEKLCDGWVCNPDLSSCLSGAPNDKKNKRHVCLVRGTAEAPLESDAWPEKRWDTATSAELMLLDDLDRVSVGLHRVYKAAADRLRRENALMDSTMLELKNLVRKNVAASIAFSEWFSCLTLLWSGNEKSAREYGRLQSALTDALCELPPADKTTAELLIRLLDQRFSILFKSLQYTDYKKHDADLIDRIPFILTYKRDVHLVVPLGCDDNTAMFSGVAAATVVNPARLTYLYHCSRPQDVEKMQTAIRYVCNYMNEKTLAARVGFLIAYDPKDGALGIAVETAKAELLQGAYSTRIDTVTLVPAARDHLVAELAAALDAAPCADAIEQNEAPLSYLLTGAGFYLGRPRYRFDVNQRTFDAEDGCEFLQYIKAEQYLKVSDMFASQNSKGYLNSSSAFCNDYEALWKRAYRKREAVWKKLCGALKEYHKMADRVVTIYWSDIDRVAYRKYRYLLPAAAFAEVQRLVAFMVEEHVFDESSEVFYYTADTCEVSIVASEMLERKLDMLFARPHIFLTPDNLIFFRMNNGVCVSFNSLGVRSFDLSTLGKHAERAKELLRLLATEFSFLAGYTESRDNPQLVSFSYVTAHIKKLLTNEGNILEVYIYYKCLKSGLFDDVATGYEINWDGSSVKSELDIIVTKGFAGLLVEAKATEVIDQEYYFRLFSLVSKFGINCKPVLVADTVEKSFEVNAGNETQRMRGEMMDIITVSRPEDVDAIDVALARLLNIDVPEVAEPAMAEDADIPSPSEEEASKTVAPSAENSPSTAREAFFSRSINTLPLEPAQISGLKNNGIHTVGDFLAQTEESFSLIKGKGGVRFTSYYLQLQQKLRQKLATL